MDEKLIIKELNRCLSNELELENKNWARGYQDK